MTSATVLFVGLTSILSAAFSNRLSMAVRLANFPRREALNGEAMTLPLSSVAKYTGSVIFASVDLAVGLLALHVVEPENGVELSHSPESVAHTNHLDRVGDLSLDVACRVNLLYRHIRGDLLTLGGMKSILLFKLTADVLALVEVVLVGDNRAVGSDHEVLQYGYGGGRCLRASL